MPEWLAPVCGATPQVSRWAPTRAWRQAVEPGTGGWIALGLDTPADHQDLDQLALQRLPARHGTGPHRCRTGRAAYHTPVCPFRWRGSVRGGGQQGADGRHKGHPGMPGMMPPLRVRLAGLPAPPQTGLHRSIRSSGFARANTVDLPPAMVPLSKSVFRQPAGLPRPLRACIRQVRLVT